MMMPFMALIGPISMFGIMDSLTLGWITLPRESIFIIGATLRIHREKRHLVEEQ
jgi:hypothetical protein